MTKRGGTAIGWGAAAVLAVATASACVAPPRLPEPQAEPAEAPRAALLEVAQADAVVPVGDLDVLVVTVRDDSGSPVPGVPVRWVVVAGSVGGIAAIDGGGRRPARLASPVPEAATVTAAEPYDLVVAGRTVSIGAGATWCAVASDTAGEVEVLAYAPDVPDRLWGEVRARRRVVGARCEWPLASSGPVGVARTLTTRVLGARDGAPLAGYAVTYEVVGGDAAVWFADGEVVASCRTDADGVASATLLEASGEAGASDVRATVTEPGDGGRVLGTHTVRLTWTAR